MRAVRLRETLLRILSACGRRSPAFRGKERLLRLLTRGIGGEVTVTVDGVRFRCRPTDLIEFRLSMLGGHDREVAACLGGLLEARPDAVVWDVGANVGAIALPLARRFPKATFYAFEPSRIVAARLLANLALNADLAGRVRVVPVALSNRDGVASFRHAHDPYNLGTGTLMDGADATESVETARGDTLIDTGRCPAPDILKIDVEGYEGEVVEGLFASLERRRDMALLFEHCVYRFVDRGLPLNTVTRLLAERGYRLCAVTGMPAGSRIDADTPLDRDMDILAARS